MTEFTPPAELTPRDYQADAIEAWMHNQGQGILHMATGTGKTLTSLFAASELARLQDDRLAMIVAAPYQHLVDQWKDPIAEFGLQPFLAYRSWHRWTDDIVRAITEYRRGSRDYLAVITTHKTFASDHFQSVIDRLNGAETLLIADEVHHLGAPHLRTGLPDHVRARLGLSATPERWYDDEGTTAINSYFTNGVVYDYGLGKAIKEGHLSSYYYVPHIIELTDEEAEDYLSLSKAIARLLADHDSGRETFELPDDEQLKQLLFKRARLIGTAENKITKLRSLIEQIGPDDVHHTLVYCGDGSIETEGEEVKRQIRRVTEILGNDLGIKAHQFTYEEDQATRERLLSDFETGALQMLVAIRCLDEGVDVPATQRAFMLASSTNPRQFVQRRGRILRPHASKEYATIHDFVVAPPAVSMAVEDPEAAFSIERNLLRKELARVATFTKHAMNHPDANLAGIPTSDGSIATLKQTFNLLDM